MNKHKDNFVENVKKIDSPLAKYTSDGTLMCVICNNIVRSEAVWNVHLNSKAHRENIQLAKQKKLAPEFKAPPPIAAPSALKRTLEPPKVDVVPAKKIKGILKNAPSKPVSTNLPSDFFDSNSASSSKLDESARESAFVSNPPDIVDIGEINTNGDASSHEDSKSETLPEGFFDDPIMDAKARHVEYKDPIEEEWDRFQKEIKEEVTVSSQIIEEDHEEATAERQIEEIDEQLRHWNRVLELERRKEALIAAEKTRMEVDDDVSSGEDEYDEYLDWRAKKSYR